MITPDEAVKYRPLSAWQALTLAELDEAYALIPTERQQYYREIVEREAAKVKAATDAEELQVAQALLELDIGSRIKSRSTRYCRC